MSRCRCSPPIFHQMVEILVQKKSIIGTCRPFPSRRMTMSSTRTNIMLRPHSFLQVYSPFGGKSSFLPSPLLTSRVLSSSTVWFVARVESTNTKQSKHCDIHQTKKTIPQQVVEACPTKWQPYLRLSRMNQPIGTWLLFWPCTWGLALSTGGLPDLWLLTLFGTGAFIMRGAGCTVNDLWDRNIDKKVRRTSDRPLASGELRMRHAIAWLAVQLSLAFSILLQLNNPCFIIGVGSLALVTIYPLTKRITNWPQAVLGATFNVGVLMGYTAAEKYCDLGLMIFPWIKPSCIIMYLAGISWTLIYDTIYAHQDREEDAQLGLGSTARRFGESTKAWLTGFSTLTVASLATCGILEHMEWPFYIGIGSVAAHFLWQIKTLNIHDHRNCSERFKSNSGIGCLVFLAIVGSGAYSKYKTTYTENDANFLVNSVSSKIASDGESMNPLKAMTSSPPDSAVKAYTSRIELKNS